jgi:hypothetical protein
MKHIILSGPVWVVGCEPTLGQEKKWHIPRPDMATLSNDYESMTHECYRHIWRVKLVTLSLNGLVLRKTTKYIICITECENIEFKLQYAWYLLTILVGLTLWVSCPRMQFRHAWNHDANLAVKSQTSSNLIIGQPRTSKTVKKTYVVVCYAGVRNLEARFASRFNWNEAQWSTRASMKFVGAATQ